MLCNKEMCSYRSISSLRLEALFYIDLLDREKLA